MNVLIKNLNIIRPTIQLQATNHTPQTMSMSASTSASASTNIQFRDSDFYVKLIANIFPELFTKNVRCSITNAQLVQLNLELDDLICTHPSIRPINEQMQAKNRQQRDVVDNITNYYYSDDDSDDDTPVITKHRTMTHTLGEEYNQLHAKREQLICLYAMEWIKTNPLEVKNCVEKILATA